MYSEEVKRRAIELSKDRSAAQVLAVLRREFPTLEVPTDERTIRRWCSEKRAVLTEEKQIQEEQPTKFDPVISKMKEEHYNHLADIASELLGNLSSITKNLLRDSESNEPEYTFWDSGEDITIDQLRTMMVNHIDEAFESAMPQDGGRYLESLFSHVGAESPDMDKSVYGIADENPYRLIEVLTTLAQRKTFKDKCPICEDW